MKYLICILLLLNVDLICSSDDNLHKSNVSVINNKILDALGAFEAIKEDRFRRDFQSDGFQANGTQKIKKKRLRSIQTNGKLFREKISEIDTLIQEREKQNFVTSQEDLPFFRNPNQPRSRRPAFQDNYGVVTSEYTVKQGKLIGLLKHMPSRSGLKIVQQFLGIPYAESPIGSRRFMPPGTPLPWDGLKIANKMGPVCPQNIPDLSNPNEFTKGRYDQIKRLLPYLKNESEDCLYLNLYVPSWERFSQPTKHPVVVYIHGESFEWNSGNAYDGSALASFGQVIVVTLNYRLGILGFMKPGLGDQVIANFGLLDQVAALQWIKENIAAFSGDPKQITLIGHGTGAVCVNFLMMSPVANGLFHRAVLLSGSALSDWALSNHHQQITMQVAQGLKCPMTDEEDRLLNCFRNHTYSDMINVRVSFPKFSTPFGPIVDGMVIPKEPRSFMEEHSDTFSRFDLMLGMTELESYNILNSIGITYGLLENERDNFLRFYMQNRFEVRPDVAFQSTIKEYTIPDFLKDPNKSIADEHRDTLLEIFSDARVAAPVIQTGIYLSRDIPKCFMYVFAHNSDEGEYGSISQSIVGEDLPYMFGAPLTQMGPFQTKYSAREKLFSQAVMKYFSNFAKTGNPKFPWRVYFYNENTPELNTYDVDWPEFNVVNQSYLHLGIPPVVGFHYRQRYMKFWNNDIVEIMKKESDTRPKYQYGSYYTPPTPRKIISPFPTGHISMYPIQVDIEDPERDPVRMVKGKLNNMNTGYHLYGTTEAINVQEIEEHDIVKLELTTFLFVAIVIITILILILVILIYLYKKKKKVEHTYDNAHVFDTLTDDKRSKFNDTDDSYILDILRKTSNGTYEQVKVNHSPINGFKLTRQTSSSTVDAHTKVSDWISSEISHYNPKVQLIGNGESNSNSNSFQSPKKGEKVSVAIDATPQARSNSILRQEPIEITKAKSSFDYGPGNGKIICQEVEVDASMIEEMPLRSFPEIRECSSSCSSIANCEECRINHTHSYSDPIETIYAPPKLYQENVTSFLGPNDINVTCRDDDQPKIPISREESLKSMQKMNFPKVLPTYPEDMYFSNAMKRRSLPPQYYMLHNTNSLNRDSLKIPPAPPPRLSSTLGRKPSKRDRISNFMTSPLMVAEEPPAEKEPEITQSTLKVGPIIPKENIYMSMKKMALSRENSSSSSLEGNQEVPPPESLNQTEDPIYTEVTKSTHTQMPQDPDGCYSITTNPNPAKKIIERQNSNSNSQSSSSSSGSSSQTDSSVSSSLTSSEDTASGSSTGTIKKI